MEDLGLSTLDVYWRIRNHFLNDDTELILKSEDNRVRFLSQILLTGRTRSCDQIKKLLANPANSALLDDPIVRYIVAWILYWTGGVQAAAEHLNHWDGSALKLLPERWQINVKHLQSLASLMTGRCTQLVLETDSEANLVPKQSLLVTQASLNRAAPEYFIIDTGAPTTLLSQICARRARVKWDVSAPRSARDGAGREVLLYPAVIDRLSLDRIEAFDIPVQVADLSPALNVSGIIAPLDVFRNASVLFEAGRDRIRVAREEYASNWTGERDWLSEPLRWSEGSPYLRVSLEGIHSGYFLVDTGAGANLLCAQTASRLGWRENREAAIKTPSAAGHVTIFPGLHTQIAIGSATPFKSDVLVKSCIADDYSLYPTTFDGYLGVPWFREHRVLFPANAQVVRYD